MNDLLSAALIWLLLLLLTIGGILLYRHKQASSWLHRPKDAPAIDPDLAIPPHRLNRIKRGDDAPAVPSEKDT